MRHAMLLLTTCLGLAPALLPARDVNGNYATFGAGSEPCRVYLEARKAGGDYERAYQEWVGGHLTAYNLLLENTYNILGDTSAYDLFNELDVLCEDNPDIPFVQVLGSLVEQLYGERKNLSPSNDSNWDGWLNEIREGAKGKTESGE